MSVTLIVSVLSSRFTLRVTSSPGFIRRRRVTNAKPSEMSLSSQRVIRSPGLRPAALAPLSSKTSSIFAVPPDRSSWTPRTPETRSAGIFRVWALTIPTVETAPPDFGVTTHLPSRGSKPRSQSTVLRPSASTLTSARSVSSSRASICASRTLPPGSRHFSRPESESLLFADASWLESNFDSTWLSLVRIWPFEDTITPNATVFFPRCSSTVHAPDGAVASRNALRTRRPVV